MPHSVGYYLSMCLNKRDFYHSTASSLKNKFWRAPSDINNVFITAPNANLHLHVPHQMKYIIDMLH